MSVSGCRYQLTVFGLSSWLGRLSLSVVPCPVTGHNAGIAGADVLQILVSIFIFWFKGLYNHCQLKDDGQQSGHVSRHKQEGDGTDRDDAFVAEQDNSKVQESFRCQSDGTDDGLQFHIL